MGIFIIFYSIIILLFIPKEREIFSVLLFLLLENSSIWSFILSEKR